MSNTPDKVRLDKWLWAARFFKTRSLAKKAIEGGKVRCNGARCKSSREIEVDYVLEIRQGWDEKTHVGSANDGDRREFIFFSHTKRRWPRKRALRAIEWEICGGILRNGHAPPSG